MAAARASVLRLAATPWPDRRELPWVVVRDRPAGPCAAGQNRASIFAAGLSIFLHLAAGLALAVVEFGGMPMPASFEVELVVLPAAATAPQPATESAATAPAVEPPPEAAAEPSSSMTTETAVSADMPPPPAAVSEIPATTPVPPPRPRAKPARESAAADPALAPSSMAETSAPPDTHAVTATTAPPMVAGVPVSPPAPVAAPPGDIPIVRSPRYRHPPEPPRYPARARALNQAGTVVVRARVAADGQSEEILVWHSSGHALLDEAAVRAVRGWAFEPASIGGRAVAAWVEVPVRFVIR